MDASVIHQEGTEPHLYVVDSTLQDFCDDYAKYLEFPDLTKKQFQNLEDTVESMLARLDEFGAFVDTITADTTKASRSFPLIQEKCSQISKLFSVVDAIQSGVNEVKNTVDVLEERASSAEKQLGSLLGPINIGFEGTPLKWLANKVGTTQPTQIEQKWVPVNIPTAANFVNAIRAQPQ